MTTKTLDCDFDLKAISDNGAFEGYGSVFGVVDSYDEIVAPGAFTDSLNSQKSAGKMPSLLWQHRSGEPIGVYTAMSEDNVGLKVAGQLALKTARGAEAYELLKMKAISGLSIGFQTREDSFDRVSGIRTLKRVDLWEVSLVTFPANDASRISGVKTIETIENLRDAERYLRDSGMSRAEAVAFISRVKNFRQSDSDEGDLKILIKALEKRPMPA
jgi:HK97 family phage prohead protease